MQDGSRSIQTGSALVNFNTHSVDVAVERLQEIYGAYARVEPWEKQPGFRMRMRTAKVGALTLCKTECANWSMVRETRDAVMIAFPLSGVLHFRRAGHTQVNEGLKHAAVARPFESIVASIAAGAKICLMAPVERLAARAESLIGKSYSPALLTRTVDQIDATRPVAVALVSAMNAAMTDATNLDRVGLWALASTGYEELLTTLAIAALFPEIARDPEFPTQDCSPAIIRRARDLIHAKAHLPMEISGLAAELGVSIRGLRASFQRHLGLSPREYILEYRLEQARRKLLAPERALSVTDIAFASGFGDLSHFSAKYRDKFGELPSETLRNAQRQVL